MLDTDGSGQIAGGANVLISRQRVTILDENGGWQDGADTGTVPDVEAGHLGHAGVLGKPRFPRAFERRRRDRRSPTRSASTSTARRDSRSGRRVASKAGLCFEINNLSNEDAFPARAGSATRSATRPGPPATTRGTSAARSSTRGSTSMRTCTTTSETTPTSAARRTSTRSSRSGSNRIRAATRATHTSTDSGSRAPRPRSSTSPALTGRQVHRRPTPMRSSAATRSRSPRARRIDPKCKTSNGCWDSGAGGTWAYPFADWYWKKVGGTSVAMVFYVHDERNAGHCGASGDCTLIYYSGSVPDLTGPGLQLIPPSSASPARSRRPGRTSAATSRRTHGRRSRCTTTMVRARATTCASWATPRSRLTARTCSSTASRMATLPIRAMSILPGRTIRTHRSLANALIRRARAIRRSRTTSRPTIPTARVTISTATDC